MLTLLKTFSIGSHPVQTTQSMIYAGIPERQPQRDVIYIIANPGRVCV